MENNKIDIWSMTGDGLKIGHFGNAYLNCLEQIKQENHIGAYIGYLEACLVNFNVIESKDNGVEDYAELKPINFLCWKHYKKENRAEIILRLSKKYLEENNLIKKIKL